MSIGEIVSLSAIIGAFLVFASVLAWGDYQTRGITHAPKARPRQAAQPGARTRQDAASETQEPIHAA
jgi:hypothetical protein